MNSLERSGCDSELFFQRDPVPKIQELRDRYSRIIVCISVGTTESGRIGKMVERIRSSIGNDAILVAGGPHATGSPRSTMRMGFDVVIRGEGEVVFPDVVDNILGRGRPLSGWPIVLGVPLEDLDTYPPVSFKHKLYPPIEITRGCLFRCRYCSLPGCFGRIRHRSVESVLGAARRLVELRDRWDFRFISPNSLGYGSYGRRPNESMVGKLLRSVRGVPGKKRIFFSTFPSEARPDFVTPGMVKLVKEFADNDRMSIGAQSGSERVLRMVRRGHGVKEVRDAVDSIIGADMVPAVDFILGFPGESECDQMKTLDFIHELVDRGCEVRVHHFLPLSGSELAGRRPSPVSPLVLSEIGRLTKEGKAAGAFSRQRKLAMDIVRGGVD